MDDTNPKISFIPKGSLVREASFLERRRPRSVAGLLAIFSFVVSVGSYAGFYFYNVSLEKDIVSMTDKINATQQTFINAPQVEAAQLFSSRANVARALLDEHTIVSPALIFLSENTLKSILYDKFSFVHNAEGSKVELTGEAQSYAALAYQGDIFRDKKELLNFKISNISLTPFGNVSFALALTFTPEHLSYSKNLGSIEAIVPQEESADVDSPQSAPFDSIEVSDTSIATSLPLEEPSASPESLSATSSDMVNADTPIIDTPTSEMVLLQEGNTAPTTTEDVAVVVEKQSVLRVLWSKFKFW